MSNDSSDSSSDTGGIDLSNLNFGPAWARDDKESKSLKKFKDRGDRDDSRRGGGGGRRQGGGQGGGDRHDRRGSGGKFHGGKKGRGRFDDRRPQRTEVEPPAGFTLKLMPLEESLDVLAKEIMQTGRTYSVFDLAKVCLQGRDRFRATFENQDQKFYRCREDNSVWLTKEEAVRQLWRGDWLEKFYTAVQTEGEAPKGSFSSVAKCGISGQFLGPPNYHGYQQNIATLHRERFGHMSLDAYKSKIKMEHGEEAVEAWLESMKTVTKWRESTPEDLKKEEPPVKESPKEQAKPESFQEDAATKSSSEPEPKAGESPAPETEPVDDTQEFTPEESSPESATSDQSEISDVSDQSESSAPPEAQAPEPSTPLFETSRDVERHFLQNHFEIVFEETNRAWVLGDIKGNMLSPGLLTLLKRTVQEEKRYPANLMPVVCRQLSGRHVAVFKWDKKLKVGPSRPHAVSDDLKLAERPQAILNYLQDNTGKKLAELWKILLPEDATDDLKHEWYHDLHWILNQGHAVLLNDTTLHIAKQASPEPPKKKSAKKKTAAPDQPAALEKASPEIPTPESAETLEAKKSSKAEESVPEKAEDETPPVVPPED